MMGEIEDLPYVCTQCRPAFAQTGIAANIKGYTHKLEQIHEDQKRLDVRVTILERNYQFTDQRDLEEQVKDVVIAEASSLIEN